MAENIKQNNAIAFPVVAIGGSAGGFEACNELIKNLPLKTGMAFVVVQHLHPSYDSALSELYSRSTSMSVLEIQDGMSIESDHIYVIPPNKELVITSEKLHLSSRDEKPPHLPIDRFMKSLAKELGSNAIGVILSGTASDGVLGLESIKAAGGITFCQDEESAKYNGMPHSAISAGCVDFVLPPKKIAQELSYLAHHPYIPINRNEKVQTNNNTVSFTKEELSKLFFLLRNVTGIDFSYYKISTLQRRITRRMVLKKINSMKEYIDYLNSNHDEIDALYQDILINVTEFFREPESFNTLKSEIFPQIISKDRSLEPIRVWIPGCSTGEEAYSVAITLLEYLEDKVPQNIQIFATDIDDQAIEKARAGIYPLSISQSVSKTRLSHFFTELDDCYQIKKSIRELCIFAKQNVFKDPPFSNIDLISCRNLLIYLVPALQKRILSIFHYALRPQGILSLGNAETIGEYTQMYETIDQKHKFYRKKTVSAPIQFEFSNPPLAIDSKKPEYKESRIINSSDIESQQMADRMIMKKYAPAAVLVNQQLQVLQFRGHTGRYLEPTPGEASLDILKLVRDGLNMYVQNLLIKSMDEHTYARKDHILYMDDGQEKSVDIEITPIQLSNQLEYSYLIVFEDSDLLSKQEADETEDKILETDEDKKFLALKQELGATKEYLQSVIEQKEIGNEELRSANEEIQSSNEELQSINEELETAKEELQSSNEELATVNEELEARNVQLAQLNDDHQNIVNSLNIAFITVDNQLRIRNFTPKTTDLMNIISTDIGRPFNDIKLKVKFPDLENIINKCIEDVSVRQLEFQDDYNHWYSMRIRPYRTSDNRIDGAVVAFLDVNEIKASLDKVSSELDYVQSVISAIRHPMLVLDKNLRVVSASNAYYDTFKVNAKDTVGNLLYHLGNGEWAIPKLRTKLENVINNRDSFDGYSVEHVFENIGNTHVLLSGRQVNLAKPESNYALMQIELVTKNHKE